MKKIGFIGVGIMGKSMVRNLMKAGFEVSIYARTKAKVEDVLQEGALWCNSIGSCAAGKDAVITIVGFRMMWKKYILRKEIYLTVPPPVHTLLI